MNVLIAICGTLATLCVSILAAIAYLCISTTMRNSRNKINAKKFAADIFDGCDMEKVLEMEVLEGWYHP